MTYKMRINIVEVQPEIIYSAISGMFGLLVFIVHKQIQAEQRCRTELQEIWNQLFSIWKELNNTDSNNPEIKIERRRSLVSSLKKFHRRKDD